MINAVVPFARSISAPSLLDSHAASTLPPPTSVTLAVVGIGIGVFFVLLVINALIWFICSLRSVHDESELTPHHRRSPFSRPSRSRSTVSFQNLQSHQTTLKDRRKSSMHRPAPPPTNRLKTVHSLLYPDHRTVEIEPTSARSMRDIDSSVFDYEFPSTRQNTSGECQTEAFSSTDLQHGFIIRSKTNRIQQEPRQINSWDDI